MTRKRLWSLTALACALLAVPSLPWMSISRVRLRELPLGTVDLAAMVLLPVLLTILATRRRRDPLHRAVGLARHGHPVAAIARRTRLSQDAIRDLLGGDPLPVSTAGQGRFFRRRSGNTVVEGASFADELSERSLDAKA